MLTLITPFVLSIVLAWVPGLIIMLGLFHKDDLVVYAASPILSIFIYSIIGEAFSRIGIFCNWISVCGTALLFALIVTVVSRAIRFWVGKIRVGGSDSMPTSSKFEVTKNDCLIFALYPFVGAVLVAIIFFSNLYSADSLAPLFDNMHHMGVIQAFLDSGQWKFNDVTSQYSLVSEVQPLGASRFYPTAWHLLSALIADICSITAMAAANVINGLFIGVVFPCAMYALMSTLLRRNRNILICGAFLSLGFAIFPWQFLIWGPLYPNLASMALFPAVAAFFLRIFRGEDKPSVRVLNGVVFVCGLGSLVVSQTNAVFCLACLFIPYVIYLFSQIPKRLVKKGGRLASVAFGVLSAVLIGCVWLFFYNLGALQEVVQYNWPATRSVAKALVGVATSGFSMVTPPQIFLSLFIFIGIFYLLKTKQDRWLICSYLFAAAIYVVCASTEGEFKHILGGFWYTDTFRIAAMTVVFAIPLASAGLFYVIRLLWKLVGRLHLEEKKTRLCQALVSFLVIAVSVYMIYGPSDPINRSRGIQSAFNCITGALGDLYGDGSGTPLDDKELAFLDEVKEIVGDDVVINIPDDGSGLAYPTDDINVYYRYPTGYGSSSEAPQSILIRDHLGEIEVNSDVRNAVDAVGAKYLLFLDHGQTNLHANNYYISEHYPGLWTGIEPIDETTPGFELVLHEDDMYLYRIN